MEVLLMIGATAVCVIAVGIIILITMLRSKNLPNSMKETDTALPHSQTNHKKMSEDFPEHISDNEYIRVSSEFFENKMIPYQFGSSINDDSSFFGREEEIEEILLCIRQAAQGNYSHLSVVGDYRIGKSSLFKMLQNRIAHSLPNCIAVYINLPTQEEFFQKILISIGEEVLAQSKNNALSKKFKQTVSREGLIGLIKELEPEINLGFLKIKPNLENPEKRDGWDYFKNTLEELFRKLNEFGEFHSIVVMIDELSSISQWENYSKILQEWRAVLDNVKGYNFITGSVHTLYELTKDEWSPFFNIFEKPSIKLTGLKANEAEDLIVQPGKKVGLYFQPKMVEYIHALTNDHPYYIQVVCKTICKLLLKKWPGIKIDSNIDRYIDKDFIELCIFHSIESLDEHFNSLFKNISPFQEKLLLDCAKSESNSCNIEFDSLNNEEKQEIKLLGDRGLIKRQHEEFKICGLLAEWLREYYLQRQMSSRKEII
jgi:hypothetical protein